MHLPACCVPHVPRVDNSAELAAEARYAFAAGLAVGEAGLCLARQALLIAAEDDAIGQCPHCLNLRTCSRNVHTGLPGNGLQHMILRFSQAGWGQGLSHSQKARSGVPLHTCPAARCCSLLLLQPHLPLCASLWTHSCPVCSA